MDSNDTSLGDLPPQLQEIIQLALSTFIDLNLPSLYIMIIASLWLAVSLCLFMALLYSSHPEKRKTLLFICCVIAVGFGTVPGILFLNLLVRDSCFVYGCGGLVNVTNTGIFRRSKVSRQQCPTTQISRSK